MPLHLLKLAVGIDDIDHLRQIRRVRAAERGGNWVLYQEPTPTGARGSCRWIDLLGHPRSDPGPTTRYRAARRTRRNGSPLLSDRGRCGAGAHPSAGVPAVPGLAISVARGRASRSPGGCGAGPRPDAWRTARPGFDLTGNFLAMILWTSSNVTITLSGCCAVRRARCRAKVGVDAGSRTGL